MKIHHQPEIDYVSIDFTFSDFTNGDFTKSDFKEGIEAKSYFENGVIVRLDSKGNVIGLDITDSTRFFAEGYLKPGAEGT